MGLAPVFAIAMCGLTSFAAAIAVTKGLPISGPSTYVDEGTGRQC
jgi:hypothetical protein